MKIKIVYGKDIRRWHAPLQDRYLDLQTFVEKTFKLNRDEYYLQFEDEEMDKMTISNAMDLDDALESSEQQKRLSLKIYVIKGSIENARRQKEEEEEEEEEMIESLKKIEKKDDQDDDNNNGNGNENYRHYQCQQRSQCRNKNGNCRRGVDGDTDCIQLNSMISSPSPVLCGVVRSSSPEIRSGLGMNANANANVMQGRCALDWMMEASRQCAMEKSEHERETDLQKKEQQQHDRQPNGNDHKDCSANWRKMALSFLMDEKVNQLLPELIRRVMSGLRQRKEKEAETKTEGLLVEVMKTTLQEETFAPIVNHEFYQLKLKPILPCLLNKVAKYQHILLNFSEEMVGAWVPDLIQVMTTALLNEQDDDDSEEGLWSEMNPNLCHYFLPMWFSFMNTHGNHEASNKQEAIHGGVQCNQCKVYPIRGARYKCCVCADYDLCANCESLGKHNFAHPLVKINQPIESLPLHDPNDFTGMRELYAKWMHGRMQPRHGWFGLPPPHPLMGDSPSHPHIPYSMSPHRWASHPYTQCLEPEESCPSSHAEENKQKRQHKRWMRFANVMGKAFECNEEQPDGTRNVDDNHHRKKKEKTKCGKHKKEQLMAELVKDITLPDRSCYLTDAILEKTWEIKNTGTVEWGEGVELVFLKGNETLALEKRYPAPNAQPQESVKVSAMIQIPSVAGRFCAYFRLQKNGHKFGPRVWVDVFAIEDPKKTATATTAAKEQSNVKQEKKMAKLQDRKDKLAKRWEKVEAKLASIEGTRSPKKRNSVSSNGMDPIEAMREGEMVSCMCGAPLIQTTPIAAYYSNARVDCDICGSHCPSNGIIYHCPAEKTNDHPNGYDLCLSCVRFHMQSFQEQQFQPQSQVQAQAQVQTQPQAQNAQDEGKKDSEVSTHVQEKPKESVKEENGVDKTTVVVQPRESNDPFEGFIYANEARAIMNMGFTDVDKIKYLLISKKGASQQVVAELLVQ